MKNRLSQCLVIVLLMAFSCYGAKVNNLIVNGSFEEGEGFPYPGLAGSAEFPGWVYNYGSRVGVNPESTNGTYPFANWGGTLIPDGARTAFLQSNGVESTLSQSVELTAGEYELNWYEAKRTGYVNPLRVVSVTDTSDVVVESSSAEVTNDNAYVFRTMSFTVAVSGTYTVTFSNTASSYDTTLLLDGVLLPSIQEVEAPIFDPAGPSISGQTDVSISCETAGASIYYTLNGGKPTTSDTLYIVGSTVTVSDGDTLQAIAVLNGYIESYVTGQTFQNVPYNLIVNGSFEEGDGFPYPGLADSDEILGWVYNYGSRVGINPESTNGTYPFANWGSISIPDGTRTAFLQSHGVESTLSQSVELTAGEYELNWYEAKRAGYVNPFRVVSVTNASDVVVESSSAEVTNDSPYIFRTMSFTIAVSGTYTITFSNTASSYDTTLLLDGVLLPSIPEVEAPIFDPASPYISGQAEVSISCETAGVSIYYTLNGGKPTTSDTLYTVGSPITVSDGDTLQAIAVLNGYIESYVTGQTFQSVSLNSLIVNGSFEEGDPFAYPGLANGEEILGWAYNYGNRVGVNPESTNGTYPFANWGGTPIPDGARTAFLQSNGVESTLSQSVELTAGERELSWYEAKRAGYANPFCVVSVTDANGVVVESSSAEVTNDNAYIFRTMSFTVPVTGTYTITFSNTASSYDTTLLLDGVLIPCVAHPVFDPAGPYLSGPSDVTISSDTAGASIYYTLNGSEPTTSDTLYDGSAISVTDGDTLQAIAVLDGYNDSYVTSQTYLYLAATPVFTPGDLYISEPTAISISTTTPNADIYYTVDGTTPSVGSGLLYTGPVTVSDGTVLQAIAGKDGYLPSSVNRQTFVIPTIPILAWYAVPSSQLSLARFIEMRDAGFTHQLTQGYPSLEDTQLGLDIAKEAGMKILAPLADVEYVEHIKDHPALEAYHIRDEPPAGWFPLLAQTVAEVTAIDPNHWCYINLLPIRSADKLQAPDYESYIDSFLNTIDPVDVLSFDHYPITSSGISSTFYENLEIVSAAARADGIPFWAFALATAHASYPVPTLTHLRFQMFSNLAYGAQGLQYFTYWLPPTTTWDFHDAPIDADGNRTAVWYLVQSMNEEIKGLSPVFFEAEVQSVGHTSRVAPVNGSFEEGEGFPYPGLAGSAEIPGWVYNYGSRVGINPESTNGTYPFANWGSTPIPDGNRTAFLQSHGVVSTLSQSVELTAGEHELNWYEAKRAGYVNPFRVVSVTDTNDVLVESSSAEVTNDSAYVFRTMSFTVAVSGTYTITFSNTASSYDTTLLLDGVHIPTVTIPDGTTSYVPQLPIISLTTSGSDGAVVSRMINDDICYLVVVNRDIDSTMTLTLTVDTSQGISTVDKNGVVTPLSSGTVSYSVDPADIVIFQWDN